MTRYRTFALVLSLSASAASAQSANPAQIDWQRITDFSIARTETTVAQFRRFADATKLVTRAEKSGGGEVYENGWVKKSGWNWQTPFGANARAANDEPAAHITFDEAAAFCTWVGAALPTDAQWVIAAYTEQRETPSSPFVRGKTYPFPVGENPSGAQCLADCGVAAKSRAIAHGAKLMRGYGHARVGTSTRGVNGLFDMGGNLWEWVNEPERESPEKRTRGGSWWYGAEQMKASYLQGKPVDTAVAYIGFRCAKRE